MQHEPKDDSLDSMLVPFLAAKSEAITMASSTRQAIVCALLVFVSVNYARSQSSAEKEQAATISGKVTIKGKGTSGVAVGLLRIEPSRTHDTHHRGITDDEGN